MNIKLGMMTLCLLAMLSTQTLAQVSHSLKPHYKHVSHEVSDWPNKFYRFLWTAPDACLRPVCAIPYSSFVLKKMNQNEGRALSDPCRPCWFRYFSMSGGINLDIGKWGNRNANLMGENYKRLSLNDVYINIDAKMNEWVEGFVSISFGNPTITTNPAAFNSFSAAEYDAAYSDNINVISPFFLRESGINNVQIEQAYATLGDLSVQPFFFQLGKQFQDFSRYEIHPITVTLTQVLSQILATSIKLGVLSEGFSGSLYVFNDPIRTFSTYNYPTNYGLSFGYHQPLTCDLFGFSIGAAYLHNLVGANDVAYNVQAFTGGGFHNHVTALALYGDFITDNISLNARYTTALQRFVVADLPKNGIADLSPFLPAFIGSLGSPIPEATGAKPWAATLQANFGFHACNKPQTIYLGYQTSSESAGLNMPKNRYLIGYGIDFCRWTSVWAEWDRDFAYRRGNGGTGKNTNLISLRIAAKYN